MDRLKALADDHDGLSIDALMKRVFEDDHLASRGRAVAGELFGTDLFDVGKNATLPQALLDALSWSAGEDDEFFAPGEFCGWPLRVWPTSGGRSSA